MWEPLLALPSFLSLVANVRDEPLHLFVLEVQLCFSLRGEKDNSGKAG